MMPPRQQLRSKSYCYGREGTAQSQQDSQKEASQSCQASRGGAGLHSCTAHASLSQAGTRDHWLRTFSISSPWLYRGINRLSK